MSDTVVNSSKSRAAIWIAALGLSLLGADAPATPPNTGPQLFLSNAVGNSTPAQVSDPDGGGGTAIEMPSCGAACAHALLALRGVIVPLDKVVSALRPGLCGRAENASLEQITAVLRRFGLPAAPVRFSLPCAQSDIPTPCIVLMTPAPNDPTVPGHYVLAVAHDAGWIVLVDPSVGSRRTYVPYAVFRQAWAGYAILANGESDATVLRVASIAAPAAALLLLCLLAMRRGRKRNRAAMACILSVVGTVAAHGCSPQSDNNGSATDRAPVTCRLPVEQLGTIECSGPATFAEASFMVDVGGEPARVSGVTTSCGCISLSSPIIGQLLEPHTAHVVRAKMNVAHSVGPTRGELRLTVASGSVESVVPLAFQVFVKQRPIISPLQPSLRATIGETPTGVLEVYLPRLHSDPHLELDPDASDFAGLAYKVGSSCNLVDGGGC